MHLPAHHAICCKMQTRPETGELAWLLHQLHQTTEFTLTLSPVIATQASFRLFGLGIGILAHVGYVFFALWLARQMRIMW
jgi:hypothetical protein